MSEQNEIHEKVREFDRKVGKIIRLSLGLESNLELFLASYYDEGDMKKRLNLLEKYSKHYWGFNRKKKEFISICNKNGIDKNKIDSIVTAIDYVKRIRNEAAHWQRLHAQNEIRLRPKKNTIHIDEMEFLKEKTMKKFEKKKLEAIKGIVEISKKLIWEKD